MKIIDISVMKKINDDWKTEYVTDITVYNKLDLQLLD